MDSVRVAVRVRPLVQHEIESGCGSCVEVLPDAQQIIISNPKKTSTFNHVFNSNTPQVDVYDSAIRGLVQQLFKGYNVTVLAYGQTGSGKTYSMGTCPSSNQTDGVIPRAITDIFHNINNDEESNYKVTVSFVEAGYKEQYKEQLYDLLSNNSAVVKLRESNRGYYIPGLTQQSAQSADDILQCLHNGSLRRTTGATAMNAQSSRSHAIFTIYIHQVKRKNEDDAMLAKFHLVDLAGSIRLKKTKTGDWQLETNRDKRKEFMEGVNINTGLFVLGNVLSSLCNNAQYVNYRDNKLTRLLKDSLGGNSITVVLACVSPAASNLYETLNTLSYAVKASKIKNKPVVNQDSNNKEEEINRLRRQAERGEESSSEEEAAADKKDGSDSEASSESESESDEDSMSVKRNVDGPPSCSCRSSCITRQCNCLKLKIICSGNCMCKNCKNKLPVNYNMAGSSRCRCKKGCRTRICSCKRNKSYCTGNCLCKDETCNNKAQEQLTSPGTNDYVYLGSSSHLA